MSPGFCPGSKGLRDPTPEEVKCPQCGYEVEIWTHELMRYCPQCHTPVMRQTKPSCIDWCTYAQECVGPQLYAKLKPQADKSQDSQPLQHLMRLHDEAIKRLGLLKGATLCLRAGSRSSESGVEQTLTQATHNLGEVIHFFDGELRDHFQKEAGALFPLLERHLAKAGSPIAQMLAEHREIEQRIAELKELVHGLPPKGIAPRAADEVERSAAEIIRLLRSHIEKENTVLFPLATASLSPEELSEISRLWASPVKLATTK